MRQWQWFFLAGIAALVVSFAGASAGACPLCSLTTTFSDQVQQSDAACLVRCVAGSGEKASAEAQFEILRLFKNWKGTLHEGERFSRVAKGSTKTGGLYFMTGTWAGEGTAIDWAAPAAISEATFRYLVQAPPSDAAAKTRLPYFFNFLEDADRTIAGDAYGEFAKAPFADVASLAGQLPRDKVRRMFADPKTPKTRLGFYALLVGLCGDASDARGLETIIARQSTEPRLGLEGMIFAYLLLDGSEGLKKIEDWKFKDRSVPISETFAAIKALELFADFAPQKISKARLSESMRLLLDRKDAAELAITDLARWQDWSIQDRLREMYGKGDYRSRFLKTAVVRYMIASTQTAGAPAGSKPAESVERGRKYLDEFRAKDPGLVQSAERFFIKN
jgi:hypothetical protein